MPTQQFINGNALTTFAVAGTSSVAVITPTSTTGFPTVPQFTILNTVTGELMLVTALGATWSVQRGYGGSTAAAINIGDGLEYSVTREMLLLGFPMKLDEVIATTDLANGVLTLTVPGWIAGLGLRGLRVQLEMVTGLAVGLGVSTLLMRINGDTSTTTHVCDFAYWGSAASVIPSSGFGFGKIGWVSSENLTTPTNFGQTVFDLMGALDTDRWKRWSGTFTSSDGPGNRYSGIIGGSWRSVAAVASIQFAADIGQSNVWAAATIKAGSRASLIGIP